MVKDTVFVLITQIVNHTHFFPKLFNVSLIILHPPALYIGVCLNLSISERFPMIIVKHGVLMDFSELLVREFVLFYFIGVFWIIRRQVNVIDNVFTIGCAERCNMLEIKVRSTRCMVNEFFHGAQVFVNIITP